MEARWCPRECLRCPRDREQARRVGATREESESKVAIEQFMVSLIAEILKTVVTRVFALCGTIADVTRGRFDFLPALECLGNEAGATRRPVIKDDLFAAGQLSAPVEKSPRDAKIGGVQLEASACAFVQCVGERFYRADRQHRADNETVALELMRKGDTAENVRADAALCRTGSPT